MAKKSEPRRLKAPQGGAAIRMYRQGLGDCFLLAFDRQDASGSAYVLVDCGVHNSQPDGRATMRQAVADVAAATGGHLDVVIATHEHSDHLCSFVDEAEQFLGGELKIDRLWLAWTENREDPLAEQLRARRGATKAALDKALRELKEKCHGDRAAAALAMRIEGATSFFFADLDAPGSARLANRLGIRDPDKVTGNELALAVLREAAKEPPAFLDPQKSPKRIPKTDAHVYALGPPRDLSLLKRPDPSSGTRKETYLTATVGLCSFLAAAGALGSQEAEEGEEARGGQKKDLCYPFDKTCRRPYDEAGGLPLFREGYGLGDPGHRQAWRQIGNDWLFTADQLALDLDRHTNNTSLVLAFEVGRPGRGQVLLFAADAQVGSWLSWQPLSWSVGRRSVTAEDLLRRTAVYKVGHHGSHNATLKRDDEGRPYGLELMPDGLVALIPVDQAAADKLRGWHMPYKPLYRVLRTKASGNVLRSDDGHDASIPVPRVKFSRVPGVAGARWRCSREQKENGHPLYYDLELAPAD